MKTEENKWSLLYINKDKSLSMKIPNYQRSISKAKIKEIKNSFDEYDFWEVPPIIMNRNYEIIDGQHRWEAYKQSKCTFDIPILIKSGIGKEEFTTFNNSTSISIAHLLFIHDTIQHISKDMPITKGSTTRSSIGVSDLAKGMFVNFYLKLRSPYKKQLFEMLDNEKIDRIVESAKFVYKVANIYSNTLPIGGRVRQIWLLYFVFLYSKGLIDSQRMERCIPKLPTTAGGDVALGENKAIFLNTINHNARKNKISMSDLF